MATLFTNPRADPAPIDGRPSARTTAAPMEIAELPDLCRDGRLYVVEHWIQEGRPCQLTGEAAANQRGRFKSALRIGLEQGNQALVLLLRWHAAVPELEAQGAATWGHTREEALRNIQEVMLLEPAAASPLLSMAQGTRSNLRFSGGAQRRRCILLLDRDERPTPRFAALTTTQLGLLSLRAAGLPQ